MNRDVVPAFRSTTVRRFSLAEAISRDQAANLHGQFGGARPFTNRAELEFAVV
jgi:hypothetical protein